MCSLHMKHVIDDGQATFTPSEDPTQDIDRINQLFYDLARKVEPHQKPDLIRVITGKLVENDLRLAASIRNREVKHAFLELLTLLECEQWCYTYQNICGSLVSRRAALISDFPDSRQVDVALFLEENGCNLAPAFSSLFQRSSICKLLSAAHEFEEVHNCAVSLSQAFFDLSPGESLALTEEKPYFTHRQSYPSPLMPEFQHFHVGVQKLVSGYYRIEHSPAESSLKLFSPDSGGIWTSLSESCDLIPGTPLRLGRFLEILLP